MDIPRRNVELALDPTTISRDWVNDDAYETTFMNALSLLFPEGEQFFVKSVKALQDRITDPELQREVVGFIGQEATHGREHRDFNELLVAHGFAEVPRIDVGVKRFLQRVRKVLSPQSQLAATCALEHFTAMLAEQLLRDARMRNAIHETVRPLWMWHALEESEHKAVAFDVYRATGGGYARRAGIMVLATAVFFTVQHLVHVRLMATRGVLWKPWRWLHGMARMYVYPGFLIRHLPAYLAYFRPGFHPNDRDTAALLASWRDELFGPNGVLREKLAA